MKNNAAGYGMVLLSAAGFGLMGIFAKLAYAHGLNVSTLLAYRFLFAGLLFWGGVMLFRPKMPCLSVRERVVLCGLGVCGYAVMASLLFRSFSFISASMAELLFYSYPLIVCVLARVVDKEPFTVKKGFVLLLSFCGMVLVVGGTIGEISWRGAAFAVGSGAVYAVFITVSNRLVRTVPPWTASAYITSSAGIALLAFGLWRREIAWPADWTGWGITSGVAVCSTFIAIVAFFEGVKRVGPSSASILSAFEPLVTLLAAAALFGERLQVAQWCGVAVMLSGFMLLPADFSLKEMRQKLTIGLVRSSGRERQSWSSTKPIWKSLLFSVKMRVSSGRKSATRCFYRDKP